MDELRQSSSEHFEVMLHPVHSALVTHTHSFNLVFECLHRKLELIFFLAVSPHVDGEPSPKVVAFALRVSELFCKQVLFLLVFPLLICHCRLQVLNGLLLSPYYCFFRLELLVKKINQH